MSRALTVTACVVLGAFGFGFVTKHARVRAEAPTVTDYVLASIEKPTPLMKLPPPPTIKTPPVATIKFTPPRIVPDKQADVAPPENKDIDNVKISTQTLAGAPDVGRDEAPSLGSGNGSLVEKPKPTEDDDGIALIVQIESSYPGGVPAWGRFLNKNLRYPDEAQAAGIQGPVMVQFIVDKEGNVSDVEAISGPATGGLREEAVWVIRKSGKWVPAIQNGRNVKSYKRQPVIFKLADD